MFFLEKIGDCLVFLLSSFWNGPLNMAELILVPWRLKRERPTVLAIILLSLRFCHSDSVQQGATALLHLEELFILFLQTLHFLAWPKN